MKIKIGNVYETDGRLSHMSGGGGGGGGARPLPRQEGWDAEELTKTQKSSHAPRSGPEKSQMRSN